MNKPEIRKGQRVHRGRRTGTAVFDSYVTVSGRQATAVRWDGSKRAPAVSFTENLTVVEEGKS